MKGLTNKEIMQYLYQCYVKVDGLWFLKVEEQFGFDKALEIDAEVWKVVPKIQARFLKSKLSSNILYPNILNDKDNLKENLLKNDSKLSNKAKSVQATPKDKEAMIDIFVKALRLKLKLDEYKFSLSKNKNLITVKTKECPWHNILIKSKRENLSSKIGSIICKTEYLTFAKEFEPEIKLNIIKQICKNDNCCIFNFKIP